MKTNKKIYSEKDVRGLILMRKQEEIYHRKVNLEKDLTLCLNSNESFEKLEKGNVFGEPNFYGEYWKEVWYPDFPDNVNSIWEMRDYVDSLLEEALKGNLEKQEDLMRGIAHPNYAVVYRDGKPILEANGVYANPVGTQYVEFFPYDVYFKGTYIGENIFKDGSIVQPEEIIRVIDSEGKEFSKDQIESLNGKLKRCRI